MFKEVRIFKENSYFEADQQLNLARWPSDLMPCSISKVKIQVPDTLFFFVCVWVAIGVTSCQLGLNKENFSLVLWSSEV